MNYYNSLLFLLHCMFLLVVLPPFSFLFFCFSVFPLGKCHSSDTKEGRDGFLEWLGGVDALQLEVWAEERKNFKVKAKEDMESGGLRTAAI